MQSREEEQYEQAGLTGLWNVGTAGCWGVKTGVTDCISQGSLASQNFWVVSIQ